jgi:hypothetical protein
VVGESPTSPICGGKLSLPFSAGGSYPPAVVTPFYCASPAANILFAAGTLRFVCARAFDVYRCASYAAGRRRSRSDYNLFEGGLMSLCSTAFSRYQGAHVGTFTTVILRSVTFLLFDVPVSAGEAGGGRRPPKAVKV